MSYAISIEPQINQEDSDKVWITSTKHMDEGATTDINNSPGTDRDRKQHQENGQGAEITHEGQKSIEGEPCNRLTRDEAMKHVSPAGGALPFSGVDLGLKSNMLNGDRLKHMKSVRSLVDSGGSNGSIRNGKLEEAQNGHQNDRKETKVYAETRNITFSDVRIQQLEHRIKNLEGELRESSAVEIGLYSVVVEHGSFINKVHAPAWHLSRLYLHACKDNFQSRRARAARSAVSGLVLVAKACGNDVPSYFQTKAFLLVLSKHLTSTYPRVTLAYMMGVPFWRSWMWNQIYLSFLLGLIFWLSNAVVLRAIISQASAKQQLPCSVEKPGGGKGNHKKSSPLKWKEPSTSKETKGTSCESFEDWDDPRTFTSALERIEAWIFSRIVESLWWQIGNWSRWLSDLFGIDDGDSHDENDDNDDDSDDERKDYDTSSKSFHLLNALSDLMMLPKDMLLSRSIRKEVCPTFGTPLIKRLLNNFVPDEFCPDPIPRVVLEALDIEDPPEVGESSVTNFPCSAAPVVYLPPPTASVVGIIGDVKSQPQLRRSGSSVLKKSYTSDDELDELDSPLTAIIDSFQGGSPAPTKPSWISKENGSRNTIRFRLLRKLWMNNEYEC